MSGTPTRQSQWQPEEDLLTDFRRTLTRAPRDTPRDRFEAWAWRALLDEDGPAILTRQAAPAHVTASAVVLTPQASHTCLVLHRRLRLWVQPGGHLEPGDHSVALAAAREVVEETGLAGELLPDPVQLDRHAAPCRPGVVDWHLDVQHALVTAPSTPVVSSESLDVAWFPVQELPTGLASGVEISVQRAVAAVRARVGVAVRAPVKGSH